MCVSQTPTTLGEPRPMRQIRLFEPQFVVTGDKGTSGVIRRDWTSQNELSSTSRKAAVGSVGCSSS